MSEHEGPEPRDCPACHEAHDTLPATPAASWDVDAAGDEYQAAETAYGHGYGDGLAAGRAESAGTLDVERLARADHVKSGGRCQDFGASDHEWRDHLAAARTIAAEYARLAEDAE